MRCELVTWDGFRKLARDLALQVRESGYSPDLVIAIARGGYMPARLISDYLDIPDLASLRVIHYRGTEQEPQARVQYSLSAKPDGRRVLLVDDVSDSGETFEVAIRHILSKGEPAELRTAALDHKIVSRIQPDYYARAIKEWHWIIYPWAVIEDTSSFINFFSNPSLSVEELAERIEADFGVRIDLQTVHDALVAANDNRRQT